MGGWVVRSITASTKKKELELRKENLQSMEGGGGLSVASSVLVILCISKDRCISGESISRTTARDVL
jgi:hypothetical protein